MQPASEPQTPPSRARVQPSRIRLEACTHCQLSCGMCKTMGDLPIYGKGSLAPENFRALLERNPWIRRVELGNFGEVLLNRSLPELLRIAQKHGVITEIDEGLNLNDASEEALEALVTCGTARIRCAVDGVTQEVYEKYRVGGNLRKVLHNIQRLNALKQRHGSATPHLIFQFIIFPHNQHQVERAKLLARMLNMEIAFKLDQMSYGQATPESEVARRLTGYSSRADFLAKQKNYYIPIHCHELWLSPQINWDGKLLGCSRNFRKSYDDNCFEGDLLDHLNGERISYAREMLMGRRPLREDLPCGDCAVYAARLEHATWVTEEDLGVTPGSI